MTDSPKKHIPNPLGLPTNPATLDTIGIMGKLYDELEKTFGVPPRDPAKK